MRTPVVITALALRREDRRNVSGYASELEYFAAETHLVVVPCVIFSSHLLVYHLVRSFAVLLFAFSSGRSGKGMSNSGKQAFVGRRVIRLP